MQLSPHTFPLLAQRLMAERKSQGLSRSQAAAVCNVSTSFIRDAESAPERCSLGKLMLLVEGLGLTLEMRGWQADAEDSAPVDDAAPQPEKGAP